MYIPFTEIYISDQAAVTTIAVLLYFINFLLTVSLIFLERRNAQSVWAWVLVLFFIPFVGFILYMLFGRTIYRQQIFKLDEEDKVGLEHLVSEQLEEIQKGRLTLSSPVAEKHKKLVHMLLYNNQSFVTSNNSVETYTNMNDKFDQMIKDIEAAEDHIHFQYYIFKLDGIGNRLYKALLKKQKEGVSVRILYDDIGSRSLSLKNFTDIKEHGGLVEAFFPSKLPLVNPRINNRNHRKIVVIDGRIGYIGGSNVGDEYIGLDPKMGAWRDTHLRIEGNAVKSLQLRFMLDWNSHDTRNNMKHEDRYFPEIFSVGDITMQIASSGPDEDYQQIKYGYLKMINSAKKEIYIQSPYFIPDQSIMEALKITLLSGVKVKIMIPSFPDHPFVYWATYSNVATLMYMGAEVYMYQPGFLHQKVFVIDDEIVSIGTTNVDNRSFILNFEVNAFIYNTEEAIKSRKIFENDIQHCEIFTIEKYEARGNWIKLKEGLANLIEPIL
ncbi:cardiolipin synthase [Jeotgalicoccus meleagridis]|uniref:Cardiolipin synthase n=1 Tax=Jeotgalicoccus meleagridis TaxID=2759181 RepID=A0A6V7R9Z0_9STAP|nr:cardiolipin synthase [Jeotgalicoccus meleagridis]CAD2073612.1 Cardiolipin synthase [Jeotgalicoccus meleagridis]